MIGSKVSRFSFGIAILLALAFTYQIADAASCPTGSGCSVSGNTVTCLGGPALSINVNASGTTPSPTQTGTPFPSTLTVSGGGGSVSSVTVTLCSYVTSIAGNDNGGEDMGLLLVSPSGRNLQLMRSVGPPNASSGDNISVLTIQDGGTAMPSEPTGSASTFPAGTYEPSAYDDTNGTGNKDPNYTSVIGSPGVPNDPQTNGSNTLDGIFGGDTVNGAWKLYLVSDAASFGTDITIASWEIAITYAAASVSSTTVLSPSPSTAYTSGMNSSVTLTATVTGSSGTPTGTVTFKNGGTNLSCSGANPATLSSGSATCVTTFSTEGYQSLTASYSGNSTYTVSSGTAAVFVQNHSANSGTTYCNTGAITGDGQSNLGFSNVTPYPSVIFIGDGVNTDITSSVDKVSVQLKLGAISNTVDLHMLLVSPDGAHALDFWSNAGAGLSAGTYNMIDGSSLLPADSAISPGPYGPTTYGSGDVFTPAPGSPAPQLPGSYSIAAPVGAASFASSFVGATGHGAWSLYVYNGSGAETANLTGGWCLDVSPGTGHPTSTAVVSSATFATKGTSVTFTATVTSSPTPNIGTVTFTEGGAPLTGAPSGGVASVSNGVATISTSTLPEGDHTIQALYQDGTDTYNESLGTVSMRVDAVTATPTVSGSTWTYCNTSGITIPAGTVTANDSGPAAPNPSNIFVTNLFGTINTATLTLDGFHITEPTDLESLLVGPNGASAPTSAQTLDFFSLTGGGSHFGPQTTTFEDAGALVSASSAPGATDAPTSRGATSYTSSPFYTLPGSIQHAAPQGSSTFASDYDNSNPNGTWSVYFDQIVHNAAGDGASGWCMNFVENLVNVSAVKAHVGAAGNNDFIQGEQGAQFTFAITNNGTGSTGDPDGNHPLTVTDTLNAAFTYSSFTGTGWSCSASGQVVTCVNHSAVLQGNSYPTLTILVNVANSGTGSVTNQGNISGGGANAISSNVNSVTIDPAAVLSVTKNHTGTFTQGSTAVWNITVNNTAAGGTTSGVTNVSDSLPGGYTIASFTGTGWSCPGSVGTSLLTCTSSQAVAGGSSFNPIQVTVNVPAASPTSVSNTAFAWGGGDLTHTSSGTAASGTDSGVAVVQVPAKIAVTSGNSQSAAVSTAFTNPLTATVTDANSVTIPSYPVAFTAPATGASAVFGNSTNTITTNTNGSGVASSGTLSANGSAGSYSVSATAGSASTTFSLTNGDTAPTVTNVTSTTANGSYTVSAVIPIQITFSKAVNVTGTPVLALNSGGTASYTMGTGTATLTFTYTVASGQNSSKLDATSTGALSLNGGAINDTASTPANLTLPAPGAAGSLGANKAIVIDTTAPTVVTYNVLFGSESFNLTGSTRNRLPWSITGIQVVFSEPIATANVNSIGGVTPTAFSGLGTNTLTWTISALQLGSFATTLAGSGSNAIKDAAGNALAGGAGFSQTVKVLYGDFNDDGVVSAVDLAAVNAAISKPYNILADMNGDGVVNATDVNIVRSRVGTSLP